MPYGATPPLHTRRTSNPTNGSYIQSYSLIDNDDDTVLYYRQQLIEDVMAGVAAGPKRILRLIKAVDCFIQKLTA